MDKQCLTMTIASKMYRGGAAIALAATRADYFSRSAVQNATLLDCKEDEQRLKKAAGAAARAMGSDRGSGVPRRRRETLWGFAKTQEFRVNAE
mmetsp:Transcript_6580/g.15952  ORF Transcript_6580/g.15952 Transcript_6580/m.15952 type:complete len:93 (+) Transcript_6580:1120-1398(+)